MKKKIACLLMALMLIVSLLPMGASAASYLNPSENLVGLIKQFEGFSSYAYLDNGQYYIGYGTTSTANAYVTEAQADAMLRNSLNTVNTSLNNFTAQHNLVLNQYQHDALLSLSYNCGTSWMNGGRLYNAIVGGQTGNQFLYAISLWANSGSVPNNALLNRRLAEANLYLNGVYSKACPANYAFTFFNANGGVPGNNGEDKMQGYMVGSNVDILVANPTFAGRSFGGWYTAATGGTGVKYLSTATANQTLYAQYGTPVTVASGAAVYTAAGGGNVVGNLAAGTNIVIVETYGQWGRFVDGWINLSSTTYGAGGNAMSTATTVVPSNGSTAYATGMVVATSGVNVRSGPGTGYKSVGSKYNGATVTIYQTTADNAGMTWGRIGDNQWISMSYVRVTGSVPSSGGNTSTGTVIWENTSPNGNSGNTVPQNAVAATVTGSGVNVRSGAGTNYPVVAVLNKGAVVNVRSQTLVGNTPWGQIDQGWICLNYVSMNIVPNNNGTNVVVPTGAVAVGVVNSNVNLNVRSGPGAEYNKISVVNAGTPITIYERKPAGGQEWGRIGNGAWVCLSYVTITGSSVVPNNNGTNNNGTTVIPSGGAYVGRVTSKTLNVRSYAGVNNAKVSTLTNGAVVTIYEIANVNGVNWGRIGTNAWVCMDYIAITGNTNTNNGTNNNTNNNVTGVLTGTVTASQLRVRAGAGTGNAVVGYATQGTPVTIYEIDYSTGSPWGRIGNGWVSMNYIALNAPTSIGVNWQ